ncbi:hypothetical protein [Aeromonas veronii]
MELDDYSFIKPHFLNDVDIFKSDIAAINLALNLNSDISIVDEFMAFHHSATNKIRHSHIRVLDSLSHAKLALIIRKWGQLYVKYFKYLRIKPPCNNSTCLYPELGLSVSGLAALSIASRYAEYWAESSIRESIRDLNIFNEWEKRLEFIGSKIFIELHNLRENGDILVYDSRNLSLPIFDVHNQLSSYKGNDIWTGFNKNGWYLVRLSHNMVDFINEKYNKEILNIGDVEACIIHALKRHGIYKINYHSRVYGCIGTGYAYTCNSRTTYFIEDIESSNAFHIMQSLRHKFEFCSIIFHKKTNILHTMYFQIRNMLELSI